MGKERDFWEKERETKEGKRREKKATHVVFHMWYLDVIYLYL